MVSLLKLFLVLSECRVVYTRTLYDHVPSSAALSSLNVELNQTLWSTTLPKKRSSTSGIFIGISWQIDLRKTQHVQIICQNKHQQQRVHSTVKTFIELEAGRPLLAAGPSARSRQWQGAGPAVPHSWYSQLEQCRTESPLLQRTIFCFWSSASRASSGMMFWTNPPLNGSKDYTQLFMPWESIAI